jgi:short-subunit dehydrogenase
MQPVTLITGASSGIGAALGREFAAHGHECVLVARRKPQLEALAGELSTAHGRRPHVLALDLLAAGATEQLALELAALGLEPAIVINSAGFGLRGAAAELDRSSQLAMIDLNVRVLTDLSLRFVESLSRHRGGIINLGSVGAFFPGPGMALYFASKAYVLSFSEALHLELKPRGIKVVAVCPGPVPTEFQARAGITQKLPALITFSAERVARETYDGFMHGKRLVVTGFGNKVATILPRFLPRALTLALVDAFQMKPRRPQDG